MKSIFSLPIIMAYRANFSVEGSLRNGVATTSPTFTRVGNHGDSCKNTFREPPTKFPLETA